MIGNIHNYGCVIEELPDLDLASALTLAGDAVSGVVLAALRGTGLRHGHGYVVQRLLVGPSTATEIAVELGITQQAVSKTLKELVGLGHVEAVPDPDDRRRHPVRLTPRGRRAVAKARAARRDLDARFRDALGDDGFERTLASLLIVLDSLALAGPVRRRAVPPPAYELPVVGRR
jgi:DNA-binding MarR family transcriptional regulator